MPDSEQNEKIDNLEQKLQLNQKMDLKQNQKINYLEHNEKIGDLELNEKMVILKQEKILKQILMVYLLREIFVVKTYVNLQRPLVMAPMPLLKPLII